MTKNSKYTGETPVTIGGVQYSLLFDWDAIAEIQTSFANTSLDALMKNFKPKNTSLLLEIGLRRNHPEMTADKILATSPPLVPTMDALGKAINRALFGSDSEPDKKDSAIPPA